MGDDCTRIGSNQKEAWRLWKFPKGEASEKSLHVRCPVRGIQDMSPEEARDNRSSTGSCDLGEDPNHGQELGLNLVDRLARNQTAGDETTDRRPHDKVKALANGSTTCKLKIAKDF